MAYGSADVIFTGLVTEVSLESPAYRFSNKVVRFSVDEAYKGVQDSTVELVTSSSTASCGYPFKQGQRYLVYARREKNGKLTDRLCSPTAPLEFATRDVAFAREIRGGDNEPRIVGAVLKYERRDIRDRRAAVAIPGVEVVLERVDQPGEILSKTVTDAEGRYEFRGLVGRFHVRAALPKGPREWTPDGKPKAHSVWIAPEARCESDSFFLTADSSIRGRLIAPAGSPLPAQTLALVPVEETGNTFSSPYFPSVGSQAEGGQYFFRDVPPGRYVLAVNPRNTPGKSETKFPLMFYPGVMSKERATIIVISQSREINLDDFMLTPPLKERWFSGTVLLANRSPAAGAKVALIDPNSGMETTVTEVVADEHGQFRLKGYESFPYWIDAYVDSSGSILYAPAVKLSTSGAVEGVELVISLTYRTQPYHK